MSEPKPMASLTSALLARKGSARPAMRPQALGSAYGPGDDLGWNDMGAERSAAPVPPVLVERAALATEIERTANPVRQVAVSPVSVATAARIGRESATQTKGRKAAFTLRLDADRHLKLRLASALTKRSSQALVSQALDAFLLSLPEVDALVAQLPPAEPAVSET
ncbi:hypothetical protein U1701_12440 [Sphingomonas sp. PB2P19]|uniref:hypothetical protein n=1 Tax=Sphingomonas rhamnosi TaxID=3096156 RepID=UPI002FC762E8